MYIFMTPTQNNFGSHPKICRYICRYIFRIPSCEAGLYFLSLHGKQDQESNHQAEQTHGFRQGKSQDSIGEQLLL
uniref:Uncharacterized protein n=1 Tax=Anguilla anguilla TaxID=7936 RepID=A0A0E9W764_ANGAN